MENTTNTQISRNMEIYDQVRSVPENAIRPIKDGPLAGKSDINAQWRLETLTRLFGPAGFGFTITQTRQWTESSPTGEVAVFVNVELRVKRDGQWSEPILGTGGNKLIKNVRFWDGDRDVIVPKLNDEAYKMAYTDAISVACKALGLGADVYWGKDDTKYTSGEAPATQQQEEAPAPQQETPRQAPAETPLQKGPETPAPAPETNVEQIPDPERRERAKQRRERHGSIQSREMIDALMPELKEAREAAAAMRAPDPSLPVLNEVSSAWRPVVNTTARYVSQGLDAEQIRERLRKKFSVTDEVFQTLMDTVKE